MHFDGYQVLMDDTEPFGRFNRAQRAVQNHMEQAGCTGSSRTPTSARL